MEHKPPPQEFDRDEPLSIPLDPEDALRALVRVDPEAEPVEDQQADSQPSPKPQDH